MICSEAHHTQFMKPLLAFSLLEAAVKSMEMKEKRIKHWETDTTDV